jgi:hypothetical protein
MNFYGQVVKEFHSYPHSVAKVSQLLAEGDSDVCTIVGEGCVVTTTWDRDIRAIARKVELNPVPRLRGEDGIDRLGYLGWKAGTTVDQPHVAGTLTVTARETSMESYSAFTDEELVEWLIWADEDVKDVELTPGLAEAFTASLDASYLEYFAAAYSGMSTEEAKRRIAAIPEGGRYLTRVLDSLDNAFADLDTETAKLDLPNMRNRKPEAIKRYLEFRLQQFKMLIDAVEDYIEEKFPATGGHS